jgi:hypothetical protein
MAKRDPLKTARNKMIADMKVQLRALLPKVLAETGLANENSLNATIGHKTDQFIDLKNEVISSPEHYALLWMEGFEEHLGSKTFRTTFDDLYDLIQASPACQEYLELFLRRSYLKHYDELHKLRPTVEEAEIWIGQTNADYGLLVSPRFSPIKKDWENDKSEIRHFKPKYWTIGHVMATGLVIPGKDAKIEFKDVDQYLTFFENVLVRNTASVHQKAVAERYSAFVRTAPNPLDVPLLIPELRYEGRLKKHVYRLDFCIIDASTMDKVGFELSPWSSHGTISGTKGKSQKEINEEASANFDKEMAKHKAFFKKHGIFFMIFTDPDLADPDKLFSQVSQYLQSKGSPKQLKFHFLKTFFAKK